MLQRSTTYVFTHVGCVSDLSNFSFFGPHLGRIMQKVSFVREWSDCLQGE